MLTPGDVVELDLGTPLGSEAGMRRPAVVVTAARILRGGPNVVQVVPLTRTLRDSSAEVEIEPDGHNGLGGRSSAQCQHVRSVAVRRIGSRIGNIGPVALQQIRGTLAIIFDL
jgi:mRNA interferase MazF